MGPKHDPKNIIIHFVRTIEIRVLLNIYPFNFAIGLWSVSSKVIFRDRR